MDNGQGNMINYEDKVLVDERVLQIALKIGIIYALKIPYLWKPSTQLSFVWHKVCWLFPIWRSLFHFMVVPTRLFKFLGTPKILLQRLILF